MPLRVYGQSTAALSDLFAPKATALTIEQNTQVVTLADRSVSATETIPVFAAQFPCDISQAAIVLRTAVAASDTSYWTITLLRYREGVPFTIASKTTRTVSGGGEGVSAYSEWNYDLVTWSGHRVLGKGDVLAVQLTPTGTPAALDHPMLTFRGEPTDSVPLTGAFLATDSFNRANSTTTLGNADTGQTWQPLAGTWGISSNQAYIATTAPSSGRNGVVLDAGTGDVTMQMKVNAMGASPGFIARAVDINNAVLTNQNTIFRAVGGSLTTLVTIAPAVAVANGDTVRFECQGDQLRFYRQTASAGAFNLVMSATDTGPLTTTKHGIRNNSDATSAARYDDFSLAAL